MATQNSRINFNTNAQASDGGGDDDDDGTEEINGVTVYLNKLTENITEQLLRDIEWSFLQKGWKGQLNESQLCTVLRESADIVVSDQHFQRMFNKMDVRKRRAVDFLQFMVYLSHEFELKRTRHGHGEERLSRLSLRLLPDQPTRGHGRGRRPLEVWGMTFKPELDDLGQAVMDKGEYVAITGKGELVVYTSDLQWTNTYVAQDSAQMTLNSALVAVLALPDFGVVCVSDVIGKLRFYKVSSTEFRLCLIIGRLPSPALCLAYASNGSDGGDARLAYGDQAGGVTVIEFHASRLSHLFRGGSDDGAAPSYAIGHVANRALPRPFGVVRFPQLHPERVADVQFCDDAGLTFASVSLSGSRSMACCRVADRLVRYVAVRDHGIGCVCVAGDTRLATGSVSGTVGVWNVGDFATTTTTTTPGRTPESTPVAAESLIRGSELAGHNAAVWNVFYNRNNGRLYSVALDNVFKVWDVRYEVCLITYDGALCPVDRRRFGATVGHFNQPDQVFTMVTDGGHTFRSVKCGKSANSGGLHAEGRAHFGDDDTHDSECVRTLYNDLYGYLVSVSATDSAIAVWNPRDGELVAKRTMAHYEMIFCETLPVEITAAGFDPSGGLLVTAAANGSVHMWDPNTAVCLNKLQTPSRGRITEVIWLPNKVLVTGWDRRITEFNDPLLVSGGKVWLTGHKDEAVLSACVKPPSLLVTTSRAGAMGFWRLETGQLIRMYRVRTRRDGAKQGRVSVETAGSPSMSSVLRTVGSSSSVVSTASRATADDTGDADDETSPRLPEAASAKRGPRENGATAAVASHFLRGRPEAQRVGTLLVATRDGAVQLWCTYRVPKYVTRFVAAHLNDDYVTAMASDPRSEYLFTSFDSGYLKTWYVTNFGVRPRSVVRPSMPVLRLRFPFLLETFFVGRAAAAANPAGPMLVNSYRAHVRRIRHVEYVAGLQLVVTSGADKSVRVWTLAGHYVGTLGSPWPSLPKKGVVTMTKFAVPLDVKREASFTTINVLMNGVNSASWSSAVWNKLEAERQQRKGEGKTIQRRMQGTKCPARPLYDVHAETESPSLAIAAAAAALHRSVPAKIDFEFQSRVLISKYVPLSGQVDASVPTISNFE